MKIIKAILLVILYGAVYYSFQFIIGAILGALSMLAGIIISGTENSYDLYMGYINGGIGITLCFTVILSAVLSFIAYWGIFLLRKLKITRICNFKKVKFSYIPAAFILGISICFLNSSLLSWLSKIDFFRYYIEQYQASNFWVSRTNTVLLIMALAVAAPLIEEVIFRGMIFYDLKQIMPVFPVIIIQGLLFGIYHFNIVQFIYASFLGIMFGLVYSWTQNLWIPVILHFSNNIMAVIAAKQPGSESFGESDIRIFLISLTVTVLLCLFFRKRKVSSDT